MCVGAASEFWQRHYMVRRDAQRIARHLRSFRVASAGDQLELLSLERARSACSVLITILAYFGWDANAIGRIGDDHAGRELVQDLGRWGVGTKLLQVEQGKGTPIIVQQNYLDARGRPGTASREPARFAVPRSQPTDLC